MAVNCSNDEMIYRMLDVRKVEDYDPPLEKVNRRAEGEILEVS